MRKMFVVGMMRKVLMLVMREMAVVPIFFLFSSPHLLYNKSKHCFKVSGRPSARNRELLHGLVKLALGLVDAASNNGVILYFI